MSEHLCLQQLSLTLNQHRVLDAIDFSILRGERVALIGPSGAGKTSLLRVMATEYRTDPPILIDGQDPWQLSSSARQKMRQQIGLIWQKPPLPPTQSVFTAVQVGRLGQRNLWQAWRAWWQHHDNKTIATILSDLGIAEKATTRCGELSGGQLQRVGVARVLYQSPALMLADEPVSSLDPVLAEITLQRLTQSAQTHGATFVCSLHAVDLALRFFPRIIGLKSGRVVFDLAVEQVSAALLDSLYADEKRSSDPMPA